MLAVLLESTQLETAIPDSANRRSCVLDSFQEFANMITFNIFK